MLLIFLVIDFLLFITHTGGDIQNHVHGRLKYSMKSTYLSEIRYSCPDWLERLWQSQMIQRMRSDWLEASPKARSYPRVYSEIFISVCL